MMNLGEGPKGSPVFVLPGNASYSWSLPQREVGTNTMLADGLERPHSVFLSEVWLLCEITEPATEAGGFTEPPHLFSVQSKKPGPQGIRDLAKGHVLPRTILAHA